MAGDWIKMRSNLWDDPRISGLADATQVREATIIGGLYWLWATADQHTEDGFLPGMTLKTIDRKTGIKNLGKALADIGWISEGEGGVAIERFDEHNGNSAKERAQTAKRVANHKSKGNAKVTQSPLPNDEESNGDTVTSALPRVREREESKQPISVSSVTAVPETGATVTAENATRKGELCKKIRILGIDAAPHLAAWAEILPAFSDDEIVAAAEKARERKPGERISLNYLLPMLKDRSELKPTAQREPPWWSSDSLTIAKGRELGIDARAGESMPDFKARIRASIGQGAAA